MTSSNAERLREAAMELQGIVDGPSDEDATIVALSLMLVQDRINAVIRDLMLRPEPNSTPCR
jgi:hypothetical protein